MLVAFQMSLLLNEQKSGASFYPSSIVVGLLIWLTRRTWKGSDFAKLGFPAYKEVMGIFMNSQSLKVPQKVSAMS